MQDRHSNKQRYFNEQALTTSKFVIPYLSELKEINEDTSILEIGCGEAGNLKPFLDLGCKRVVGIDLSPSRIKLGKSFFSDHPKVHNLELIAEDIYDTVSTEEFDIIITRDVIEHIPNQDKFMARCRNFIKSDGIYFMGFPPWYNPFGGHQQTCKSRILSKLPYFHILPTFLYKGILKIFGESDITIQSLVEIKETGITIDRLNKILKKNDYSVLKKTDWFINPNYETKFGLKPRKQLGIISAIPFVRNFLTTASYYVVRANK